jgi:hypothetical protein
VARPYYATHVKEPGRQVLSTVGPGREVNEEVIRRDVVVDVLMLQGLSSAQAIYITDGIVARVKSRTVGPQG